MARLLALMVLILGSVACMRTQVDKTAQDDRAYFTSDLLNGLYWRRSAQPEKMMFVAGSADGFASGLGYAGKPAVPSWLDNKATYEAVIKEMDSFYEDGANISQPMIYAFVYSEMKLAGATQKELDDYATRYRRIVK